MLWNEIYNFFVINVFGGYLYNGSGYVGYPSTIIVYGNDIKNGCDVEITLFSRSWPLGNYFSFIATIITIVIIVTLCALFIWKIIKLVGGLLR